MGFVGSYQDAVGDFEGGDRRCIDLAGLSGHRKRRYLRSGECTGHVGFHIGIYRIGVGAFQNGS